MNRRIPNGTYGGVRGRGLAAPSYSIDIFSNGVMKLSKYEPHFLNMPLDR